MDAIALGQRPELRAAAHEIKAMRSAGTLDPNDFDDHTDRRPQG
ncbi:hypothetical protein WMF28_31650 [Sorangium sp. So ce590]